MLKLEVSKSEPLEINGEKYAVHKNALEILKMVEEIKNTKTKDYIKLADDLIIKIDSILGEGAFEKLSGGQSVSYYDLGVWFNVICQTVITNEVDKAAKIKEDADRIIKQRYE